MSAKRGMGLLATLALPGAALLAQGVTPPVSPTVYPRLVIIRPEDEKNEAPRKPAEKDKPADLPAPIPAPPAPAPVPYCPDPVGVLEGPTLNEGRTVPRPKEAQLSPHDRPLAIN